MTIQLKTKYIFLGVLLLILAILAVGYGIGRKHGRDALKPTVDAQEMAIKKFSVEIENYRVYVSQKEQEISSLRDALHSAELSREELRKLHLKSLQEITRLEMRIDTLLTIPHEGQVVVKDTCFKNQPVITLPFMFTHSDKWMYLLGTFKRDGKLDLALKMNIDVNIFSSYDRKENKYLVTVTSTNPYLETTSLKSQKFDAVKQKKWGVGLQAGYGLIIQGTPTFRPYLGIGVNRNVISF